MKLFIILLLFSFQAFASECSDLRTQALKLKKEQLSEIQKVVDDLIKYNEAKTTEQILKSSESAEYLQLNNYCLFVRGIDDVLKKYIRSYQITDLSSEQKELVKNKALQLLKNIIAKRRTSEFVLLSYSVLYELGDLGVLNKIEKELIASKTSFDEFKKNYMARKAQLIKAIQKTQDKTQLRKDFYQKDFSIASGEMKLIESLLSKL